MQFSHRGKLETRSQDPLPVSETGKTSEPEENEGLRRTTEDLVGRQTAVIDARKAEIRRLRTSKERYARKYDEAKERIMGLEREVKRASRVRQASLEKRDKRIQAVEDELARAKELLSARTKELSGAQSFLSTTDRLSETEVLGIVRDLNENVFQAAANLIEEWEKLALARSTRFTIHEKTLVDFSQFYGPTLVDRAYQWDPAAVTYLVQSCLCYFAMEITSSWRRGHDVGELKILGSVYERLSASEAQAISARWRSLTHAHLSEPSSSYNPTSIVQQIANVLWITGSFQSVQDSLDFVKANAFNRLETVYQLASRLESVFMVDLTSCDMYLLCDAPRTTFDDTRMTREFECTLQRRDKVAGITGVGVEKRVWGRRGEELHVEVLLKATVVLEGDFVDS